MTTLLRANPTARAPRLCPGGTVVCLGGGPSLTPADVDACRGRATVIAVNDSWRLAPWADALMASDAAWWAARKGVPEFGGLKFSLEANSGRWPGVTVLQVTGDKGIEPEPTGLRTGRNSGAAAINLAVHFGAARVLLLGYDLQAKDEAHSHWFGAHQRPLRGGSPYQLFRQMFEAMVQPLKDAGVSVINCTAGSALRCFPFSSLAEALA